jgi:hypothetical protein
MSRKPAAALSASLVATKGAAVPASDMPGRGAPAGVEPAGGTAGRTAGGAAGGTAGGAVATRATPLADGAGQPLNFRVSDAFRREFKVYAAQHGLKLNELLRRSFEAYRSQNGD